MKERPILFNGPMVRALLAGTKTQTRSVANPQPEEGTDCPYHVGSGIDRKMRVCPYGKSGGRLWVRETWAIVNGGETHYRATFPPKHLADIAPSINRVKWKPSIFLRRKDSRITLDVVNVRIERLQSITEEDAKAEGVQAYADAHCAKGNPLELTPVEYYKLLWNTINSAGSWDANPWVWVVEFKRTKP